MAASPTVSVSSFSLREELGPIVFRFREAGGKEQSLTLDNPRVMRISEFPARAKAELGVDAIETVGLHFDGLGDPEIDLFDAALRDAGVRLLNICLDFGDLADRDDVRRAADVAEHKRWIKRFAAMGTAFVRVNPGSPMNQHRGEAPPRQLVDALVELGTFASEHGTRLLVENHGGPSSDPKWLGALLDAVGTEFCGLLLDLGNFEALQRPLHAALAEGTPSALAAALSRLSSVDLTDLYEAIDALAPRAEVVSVKTHVVNDDGSVGYVDLRRALDILAARGFSGPLSVEYEGVGGNAWAKSRRIADLTRELASATSGIR